MLCILRRLFSLPEYKNPNKDFWKYYLSTIVVPIRIEKKILSGADDKDEFVTIGFLCIDHRWPISKALKYEILEYTKGYADALFSLMHEIEKRDKQIEESEKNEVKV